MNVDKKHNTKQSVYTHTKKGETQQDKERDNGSSEEGVRRVVRHYSMRKTPLGLSPSRWKRVSSTIFRPLPAAAKTLLVFIFFFKKISDWRGEVLLTVTHALL